MKNIKWVPVSTIDDLDLTFQVKSRDQSNELIESIKNVGLMQPIRLATGKSEKSSDCEKTRVFPRNYAHFGPRKFERLVRNVRNR